MTMTSANTTITITLSDETKAYIDKMYALQYELAHMREEQNKQALAETANAANAAYVSEPAQRIKSAEAIYAFMGYLSSREAISGPFSAHHTASSIPALIEEFCQSQGWSTNLEEEWYKKLKPFGS